VAALRCGVRGSACGSVAILAVLAGVQPASGQAWVPPARIGVVSVVYQTIDNTIHRLSDGSVLDGYESISTGALFNLDYAFTDRVSVALGVPYIGARYRGPEPSFFSLPVDDCRCWNRGWQDLTITGRFNVVNGAFALTPSVSVGLPTHGYDYVGEAVLGRNLKEMRVAIDAGQRLDAISPRLAVAGRYSYALVERVLDLPNDRSNASVEPSLLVTRKLSARATFSWQRSHGGLRTIEFETDEQWEQYDRLLRDNYFHLGGGVAYSFPRFDVFASYIQYVSGTDTHGGRAITVGFSWPFEMR
jgi:hypothetical protein